MLRISFIRMELQVMAKLQWYPEILGWIIATMGGSITQPGVLYVCSNSFWHSGNNSREQRYYTVYRAVDPAEVSSINKTGQFLLQNGGVEAKYFARSLQDAHWHGQRLYPNGYSVVQGTVSSKVNPS